MSAVDPRLTLVRDGLADLRLQGLIPAERFARTRACTIISPSAPLTGAPDLLDTDPRFATQESRTQNAEAIGLYLPPEHVHLFSNETGLRLDLPAATPDTT